MKKNYYYFVNRGSTEEYLQKGQSLEKSQVIIENDIKKTTNTEEVHKKLFYLPEKNKLIYSRSITKPEIESGLEIVLSHFNQDKLFSRTIMTEKLGYQREIFSKSEALEYFKESNFVDCRINSFPSYTEYKGLQRYPVDLIFVDLDRHNFETEIELASALNVTLRNIKKKLGDRAIPTVLKTGGGYHIILPISCPISLENIKEFNEFDRPSEQFLRFAKDILSNGKADKQNNPSFKSCLLRIPGSINSKYGNKVTIVQKWNGYRPNISLELLLDFKRYLKQKDRQKQLLLNSGRNRTNNNYDPKYYVWVDLLIQSPIPDHRKLVIDLILAPYLINVKQLSFEESYTIIKNWLDKCHDLENLDNYRNFEYRIKYALKNAMNKQIGPMSQHKIKTDSNYIKLYILLKQKGIFQ